MSTTIHRTPSGFTLPSIHSWQPFFTLQPNPITQADQTRQWIRLILAHARHKRLFVLSVEDALVANGSAWSEIFKNERIRRSMKPTHLTAILQSLVAQSLAVYEPPRQTQTVMLYWRRPEDWGEVLFEWASSTGQLNTILTFYEITSPPLESQLTDLPLTLLRRAIGHLQKTGRAQIIEAADGGGVRLFAAAAARGS